MSERMKLIQDVFECMHCEAIGPPFEKRQSDGRFFRFPPMIGGDENVGDENVKVLFVGINPRISDSNRQLHENVSGGMPAFVALAANRDKDIPYIYCECKERHYWPHARMVNQLFSNSAFEEVAAVTELYFCASKKANGLDRLDYPCATKFMERVFNLIRPRIVVAVGRPVERYLRRRFKGQQINDQSFALDIGDPRITVVPVPHPNAHGEHKAEWEAATAQIRRILGCQPMAPPELSNDDRYTPTNAGPEVGHGSNKIFRQVPCEWHERYGWKPFQRAADLEALEADPDSRVEFHLTREGRTEFILSMTADDWKTALGRYYIGPNWHKNGYAVSLNRSRGGRPLAEFVPRWVPYIRRPQA